MAYRTLFGTSCSDSKEMFRHTRDFLCSVNGIADYSSTGIGWTLFDEVYAVDEDTITDGDYFVVHSTGEDSNLDSYYKIIYKTTSFQLIGYIYWDATGHTGTGATSLRSVLSGVEADPKSLYIYGDLTSVAVLQDNNAPTADYSSMIFGALSEDFHTNDAVVCSHSLTAGSGVVMTMDSALLAEWSIGDILWLYDDTSFESAAITNISGLDITVDLVNSYASGCSARGTCTILVQSLATALTQVAVCNMVSGSSVNGTAVQPAYWGWEAMSTPDGNGTRYFIDLTLYVSASWMYGTIRNIKGVYSSANSQLDSFTDGNGDTWRFIEISSDLNLYFKEA